jgi:hypothetical protein
MKLTTRKEEDGSMKKRKIQKKGQPNACGGSTRKKGGVHIT